METIERRDLERMRDWAHEQVAGSAEPAWSWYQHMKLRETLDAILSGMDRSIQVKRPGAEAGPKLALIVGASRERQAGARSRNANVLPS